MKGFIIYIMIGIEDRKEKCFRRRLYMPWVSVRAVLGINYSSILINLVGDKLTPSSSSYLNWSILKHIQPYWTFYLHKEWQICFFEFKFVPFTGILWNVFFYNTKKFDVESRKLQRWYHLMQNPKYCSLLPVLYES